MMTFFFFILSLSKLRTLIELLFMFECLFELEAKKKELMRMRMRRKGVNLTSNVRRAWRRVLLISSWYRGLTRITNSMIKLSRLKVLKLVILIAFKPFEWCFSISSVKRSLNFSINFLPDFFDNSSTVTPSIRTDEKI